MVMPIFEIFLLSITLIDSSLFPCYSYTSLEFIIKIILMKFCLDSGTEFLE